MEQLDFVSEFVQRHRDEELIKYLYAMMNSIVGDASKVRNGEDVNLLISDYGSMDMVMKILKKMKERNAEKVYLAQEK